MITILLEGGCSLVSITGVDAIANVLKKARKTGMQAFGHSYKTSVDENMEPAHV